MITFAAMADGGILRQECSMESKILGRTLKYAIYLPQGYLTHDRSYPVLYLLHGLGDDYRGWSQQGDLTRIADREIAQGRAAEMIIVMPDGAQSWYVNTFDDKTRYEDMFFEELIPHIDSTYKTLAQKQYRAIAGLSMGGYGSLLYAVKHPDRFVACCPMSAAVYSQEDIERRGGDFKQLFEKLFGPGVATPHWKANSVLELMASMPESQKKAVRFYIDCGDDDFLYSGNSNLHIIMRDKNIPHEYRVRDGAHNWTYWRASLCEAMKFISQSFVRL